MTPAQRWTSSKSRVFHGCHIVFRVFATMKYDIPANYFANTKTSLILPSVYDSPGIIQTRDMRHSPSRPSQDIGQPMYEVCCFLVV